MIIGLTGSFGAGKGAVANYLVKQKNFAHLSARDFIIKEIEKRGLPINRDSMAEVANDLRQTNGPTYIFEQLVTAAKELGGDVVVESVRAVAEADFIKEQGGFIIGVDADPKVRYKRIVKRGSETDHISFTDWREQEIKESNPDDPTKQDIYGALKKSDVVLLNQSTLPNLYKKVDEFLAKHQS